jgi:osmotically-inducible protein OsmY
MTLTAQAGQDSAITLAESPMENTELNTRDKTGTTLTPDEQKETQADLDITAAIRQAIVRDESKSVNAQNVKIITQNGVVTLRGPVETKAESLKLQKIAEQTPGVKRVDNQLENIAP